MRRKASKKGPEAAWMPLGISRVSLRRFLEASRNLSVCFLGAFDGAARRRRRP